LALAQLSNSTPLFERAALATSRSSRATPLAPFLAAYTISLLALLVSGEGDREAGDKQGGVCKLSFIHVLGLFLW
jgi:hypothetical protein